jgi:DNA mismatch repair ATPase MutL
LPVWRCAIAQEGEELIILDQHGAHERILYERLSESLRAKAVPLPSPVVAKLPEDLAPEAWNFEAEMEALGFRFEPFGKGALRITAVPETVTDPEIALLAALHALAGGEDLARALACKGSTRFGESLTKEEMEMLLREWSICEFGETCTPRWKTYRPALPRLAEGRWLPASRIGEGRSFRLGDGVLGISPTLTGPVFAVPFYAVSVAAKPLVFRCFAPGALASFSY